MRIQAEHVEDGARIGLERAASLPVRTLAKRSESPSAARTATVDPRGLFVTRATGQSPSASSTSRAPGITVV